MAPLSTAPEAGFSPDVESSIAESGKHCSPQRGIMHPHGYADQAGDQTGGMDRDAGELGALLLEGRLIKERNPVHNCGLPNLPLPS